MGVGRIFFQEGVVNMGVGRIFFQEGVVNVSRESQGFY